MRLMTLVTALTLTFASQASACGPDSDCQLGERHYRIAMPEGHDGTTPVGAIVFAHGFRGSAQGAMRNKFLRKQVSDMGLALIAVKSADAAWDIPFSPRHFTSDGSAEFAYFENVLEDAAARHPIDRDRVMATGFSAGGMMVWNLACARPDLFAGFAPVSGTFWLKPPETCTGPVTNIVHIHGDNDTTVPLTGRVIRITKQGEVAHSLAMYAEFGDFGPVTTRQEAGLRCEDRSNTQGNVLEFCLFEGGHSFSVRYLGYAWERLEQAGAL